MVRPAYQASARKPGRRPSENEGLRYVLSDVEADTCVERQKEAGIRGSLPRLPVCLRHWGPLSGVKGILVRKGNSARLVLAVQMLGRAAAVEIDSAFVEPVSRVHGKSADVSPTRFLLNCQTI